VPAASPLQSAAGSLTASLANDDDSASSLELKPLTRVLPPARLTPTVGGTHKFYVADAQRANDTGEREFTVIHVDETGSTVVPRTYSHLQQFYHSLKEEFPIRGTMCLLVLLL
jgi:hypothetical protein